jgi:hypothetical protein
MKHLYLILLGIFLFSFRTPMAQPEAFQAGEKIQFTVFYNVIGLYVNAGNATFTVNKTKLNTQDVYHVVGEGKTNPRYDWIFKVRDRYESYFHSQTMEPLKFIRDVHEGDYKKREEVIFDHKNNKAISKNGTYNIPDKVQDIISSLYFARNLDYNSFKVGDMIPFNMFLDDEVHNMYIRYMGKETVKTKYGKFKAIKLRPLLLKGNVFDGGEKMTIWVSDDNNHLPLRIESPLTVGKIKVDLMGHQNIRHQLSAYVGTN